MNSFPRSFSISLLSLGTVLLSALGIPATCIAHPLTQGAITISSSSVEEKCQISLTMKAAIEQVTVEQAAHFNPDSNEEGESLEMQWAAHASYLLNHIKIHGAGSEYSMVLNTAVPITRAGTFVQFPFLAVSPSPCAKEITLYQDILREVLFAPGNPWEASYVVSVTVPGIAQGEPYLLTSARPLELLLEADTKSSREGQYGLFKDFAHHGIWHILEGYDHLLFASALALSTFILWDVVRILGAFTLAHTITLTLAALGLVRMPSSIVEPLIALSIVVAGLVNLLPKQKGKSFARSLYVAFFFGLFHGLGFAGGLIEAMQGLPSLDFWTAIAGFSLGVEAGHQLIVLPLLLLMYASRRLDLSQTWSLTPKLVRALSLLIALGGAHFLIAALAHN